MVTVKIQFFEWKMRNSLKSNSIQFMIFLALFLSFCLSLSYLLSQSCCASSPKLNILYWDCTWRMHFQIIHITLYCVYNIQCAIVCSFNNVDADLCPSPIQWKLNSNNNANNDDWMNCKWKRNKKVKSTKAIFKFKSMNRTWLISRCYEFECILNWRSKTSNESACRLWFL